MATYSFYYFRLGKTFDKVDQDMFINALYRLNIPEKTLEIIKSFYSHPKFRIKDLHGCSKADFKKQESDKGAHYYHTGLFYS